jgi:CBS domain containing-hemolysin-like protein
MKQDLLYMMEIKAKKIKRIRKIRNAILSSGCYHNNESELQIMKAEKNGSLTDNEKEAINKSWDLQSNIAKELMEELINYCDKHEK